MPVAKLTKSYVDRLNPGLKDIIHFDKEVRGFGVKVTPKGKKVYLVQYRPHRGTGNPRKFTIGPHGDWTLENAKRKAQEVIAAKARGDDLQAQRRAAKKRLSSDQFNELVEKHIEQHVSQFRQPRERTRLLRREFVTHWRDRSVHEINKRDVRAIIENIYHRPAPRVANTALVAIKVFFQWCVEQAILDAAPCGDMKPIAKEKSRDRILSDDELRSILNAASEIGHPFGSLVEALVLTAQRKGEVAKLTWEQIDLASREWHLPAENSKNGKAHVVHLSEGMVALLQRTPRLGRCVFSTDGDAPYQGFSKAKARLDRASGVTDWTLHDLRRTAVSGMARLGVAHHVADKILNHQSGAISGVAAVYQRHEFMDERKRALEAWGGHVASLLHPGGRDNVSTRAMRRAQDVCR